jgi:hypothetical protein
LLHSLVEQNKVPKRNAEHEKAKLATAIEEAFAQAKVDPLVRAFTDIEMFLSMVTH